MTQRILIIGAGYAGVIAANRLATSPLADSLRIAVVNPRDFFVERIRLHQFAAGTAETVARPLMEVLHPAVDVLVDTVTVIRAGANRAVLASGDEFSYDYLIYAAGSGVATSPPGTSSVASWEAAGLLAARLSALGSGTRVAIVGGGLTAVETAGEIAGSLSQVAVGLHTNGVVVPSLPTRSRTRLRKGLTKLGVAVTEQTVVPDAADLRPALGADEVIWCAGFASPTLARDSGLAVDERHRLIVDADLSVPGYPRILGAGDAAVIGLDGYRHHRQSCASAMPMGGHAADTILAKLREAPTEPHSQGYLVQCISIGRRDALIQPVYDDDRPRRAYLAGRLGAFAKETVCRYTVRWMRGERARHRSYSWPKSKPQRPHLA